MHALQSWTDEHAFLSEDRRRRSSDEVDLGSTWHRAGSVDTWHLAWLRDTGELYVCRNDSLVGTCSEVRLLAVLPEERVVDALLDGWRTARWDEDGLTWLERRLESLTALAA